MWLIGHAGAIELLPSAAWLDTMEYSGHIHPMWIFAVKAHRVEVANSGVDTLASCSEHCIVVELPARGQIPTGLIDGWSDAATDAARVRVAVGIR
jgi:hypothetical protein